MNEFKLGDTVEFEETTCLVMDKTSSMIGISHNNGYFVGEKIKRHRDRLYKLGFKNSDPIYFVSKSDLKLIKKLEDLE